MVRIPQNIFYYASSDTHIGASLRLTLAWLRFCREVRRALGRLLHV